MRLFIITTSIRKESIKLYFRTNVKVLLKMSTSGIRLSPFMTNSCRSNSDDLITEHDGMLTTDAGELP